MDLLKSHGFRQNPSQGRKIWKAVFPVALSLPDKFPPKRPWSSPVLMTLRSWIRLLKERQEMCEGPHVPVVGLNVSSYPTQRPVSCHFSPSSSFSSTYDWYRDRVTWWNSIKDAEQVWFWGLSEMRWCVYLSITSGAGIGVGVPGRCTTRHTR